MESIDRYLKKMMMHLPERDDDSLFDYSKLTVERVGLMANDDKETIEEAFMDIIDLIWKTCEDICRITQCRLEKIPWVEIEDKSENYWSRIKRLYEIYNVRLGVGESLCSRMQFVQLEYLDDRQDADFDILMEEILKQATEAGANAAVESGVTVGTKSDVGGDAISDATTSTGSAKVYKNPVLPSSEDQPSQTEPLLNKSEDSEKHFEKELKLQMTWGRVIVFWYYWISCRKETIDILNYILDILEGEEVSADETNPVQVFLERIVCLSQDDFGYFPLQFAHIVNNDFSCYKVLRRKLKEFRDLVTSSKYLEAFGMEPKDLFFNISTFQTDTSAIRSETCHEFEICENIISREQEELGETAKLLAYTSRPLLHLKDLLRKLYDEGRLNRAGIDGVINDLHQEETDMSTMINESLLSFLEVSSKVNEAAEQLRKNIEEWLPKRDESILKMKKIIEKLNKTTKDVAITQTVSSSVGIVGGALTVGCLLAAPFTFGTSLLLGGVVSGLGAATAIGAAVAEIVIDKGEMEKARTCIEEDKVLVEEVAKRIENLHRNSTMLLRYIPQDELESLISVLTDPQSTAMLSIASKSQVDPRIAIYVARFISIGGKAVVMPFSRVVVSGVVFASKAAVLSTFRGFFVLGAIFDIYSLVQASVKLGKGAKSEYAEKLEEVVQKMEYEKGIIEKCLAEMN